MSARDLVAYAASNDLMTHFIDREFEWATLCSLGTSTHVMRPVQREVNCMTCLVRANEPSLSERMATALHVPKEFLYGK